MYTHIWNLYEWSQVFDWKAVFFEAHCHHILLLETVHKERGCKLTYLRSQLVHFPCVQIVALKYHISQLSLEYYVGKAYKFSIKKLYLNYILKLKHIIK